MVRLQAEMLSKLMILGYHYFRRPPNIYMTTVGGTDIDPQEAKHSKPRIKSSLRGCSPPIGIAISAAPEEIWMIVLMVNPISFTVSHVQHDKLKDWCYSPLKKMSVQTCWPLWGSCFYRNRKNRCTCPHWNCSGSG